MDNENAFPTASMKLTGITAAAFIREPEKRLVARFTVVA
jgi:hypothetical protein